jgi:cellulose synthase/poly-beta-1,6-N-acetylglucosamine synthase-like glycosyltransferase
MATLLLNIFFITFLLCLATYFIFPLVIALLGKLMPVVVHRDEQTPFVSIIISAYNEAKDIEHKIVNTLKLDYPSDRMEILIGSDGSSDETAVRMETFMANSNSRTGCIRFFNYQQNRGKTSVQNDLVAEAKGEILVFTDAASFLPAQALKKLIRNFSDVTVGCVAGKLQFVKQGQNITTESQGVYWRYEMKIREMESRLGRLIGVDGPLYAVKRENYVPLNANIISDLITPLLVLEQGKKVILEPEAIVEEEPTRKGSQEFNTRRRIVLRGLVGIFSHPELFHPFRQFSLTLQLFFHKILRWFVGPLVIINCLCCIILLLLGSRLAILATPLYVLFFVAALLGWYCDRKGIKNRLLTVPYYFCLVNLAATFGIADFLRKKQSITWETVRD